jgi:large subunit ribosomal protein L22
VEARATVKYLRTTPRKARLVADAVRGRKVADALVKLEHGMRREVARDIAKLLKSAVANVQSKNLDANVDVDELRIKQIRVDEGPARGWYRARAQGRYGRILKRTCHVTVTVCN